MTSLFENNDRRYFSLCEDWTFHYVFSKDTEESRQALMGLINVILDREDDPITEIKLQNPIFYGYRKSGKGSILDIRAQSSKGEVFDIEMENGDLSSYGNRSLKYGSRLVNSSLESGDEYDKMKKSIVISITTGIMFPQLFHVHNAFCILNRKKYEVEPVVQMTDRIEFHFLELGKIDGKKPVSEMEKVEKVAAYLKYAGDESHEAYTQELLKEGGKEIAMMEYVFRELTADEIAEEIRFSEVELDRWRRTQEKHRMEKLAKEATEQGMAQGLEKGLEQGLDRINCLNRQLAEQGRVDDIIKAASDPEYQKKLLDEFQLNE